MEPQYADDEEYIDVDPDLVLAIIDVESNGNPDAVSTAGARGLMQVMPYMFEAYGGGDPTDPVTNVKRGSAIIRDELKRYDGNIPLALAAYNAGSPKVSQAMKSVGTNDFGAIAQTRALPLETRNYVPKVMENYLARKAARLDESAENMAAPDDTLTDEDIGTKDLYTQELENAIGSTNFDAMAPNEQIQILSRIYDKKKRWLSGTDELVKNVADTIYADAQEWEKPDVASLAQGYVANIKGSNDKELEASADVQRKRFIADLKKQGVYPATLGSSIDETFNAALESEQQALATKNRGFFGTVAVTGRDMIRGAVEGYGSAIAAFPTVLGYEEAGEAITDAPRKFFGEARELDYMVDAEGNIATDPETGEPITRVQGQLARGIGNVGAFLAGGSALRAAGWGLRGVAGYFGGVNGLSSMQEAYSTTKNYGGTRDDALTAAFLALPASAATTAMDLMITGSGQYWARGLDGVSKARAYGQITKKIIGDTALGAGQEVVEELGTQGAASYALGENIVDPKQLAVAGAIGAIAAGGLGAAEAPGISAALQAPIPGTVVMPTAAPGAPVIPPTKPGAPGKPGKPTAPTKPGTTTPPRVTPLSPEEQAALGRRFQEFINTSEDRMVIPLDDVNKVPKGLLEATGTQAVQISPKEVAVLKNITYQPPVTKDIADSGATIQRLTAELANDPSPSEYEALVTKQKGLNQEITQSLIKLQEEGVADTAIEEAAVIADNIKALKTEQEQYAKYKKSLPENDPIGAIAQKAYDQISATLASAYVDYDNVVKQNVSPDSVDSFNKTVEKRQELVELTDALRRISDPVYIHNYNAKQKELADELAKNKKLRTESAKADDAKLTDVAAVIDTQIGKVYVVPFQGKWYPMDEKGALIGDGERIFRDVIVHTIKAQGIVTPGKRKAAPGGTENETTGKSGATTASGKAPTSTEGAASGATPTTTPGTATTPTAGTTEPAKGETPATDKTGAAKKKPRKKKVEEPEGIISAATEDAASTEIDEAVENATTPASESRQRKRREEAAKVRRLNRTRLQRFPARKDLPAGKYTEPVVFSQTGTTPVSVKAVLNEIKAAAGGKLFEGGLMSRPGVLGYYNYMYDFIKTKRVNDIPVAVHEVAHRIDKNTFGRWDKFDDNTYALLPDDIKKSLATHAEIYYPINLKGTPLKIAEGFAMFVQNYATGAPVPIDVLNWFNTEYAQAYPQEYKVLQQLKTLAFAYGNQTVDAAIKQFRSADEESLATRAINAANATAIDDFQTKFVDYAYPFKKILTDYSIGGKRQTLKDMWDTKRNSAPAYAYEVLHNNVRDFDGNVMLRPDGSNIPVIDDIVKRITDLGLYDKFVNHLVAARANHYISAGLEPGLSADDIRDVLFETSQVTGMELIQNPSTEQEVYLNQMIHVKRAVDDYYESWSAIIEGLSNSSAPAAAYVNALARANLAIDGTVHGYYVPFIREGRLTREIIGKPVIGSSRRIGNPLLAIEEVLTGVVHLANKAWARDWMIQLADNDPSSGAGDFIRRVVGPRAENAMRVYTESYTPEALEAAASAAGASTGPIPVKSIPLRKAAKLFIAPELPGVPAPDGYTVVARANPRTGKVSFYEVANDLQDVLSYTAARPEGVVKAAAAISKRIMQTSVTTLRPEFVAANFARDFLKVSQQFETNNPVMMLNYVMQGMSQSFMSTLGFTSEWYKFAERIGAISANRASFERSAMDQIRKKNRVVNGAEFILSKAEDFLAIGERGLRIARMIEEGKRLGVKDVSGPLTSEQINGMLLAYMRATTNFGVSGTTSQRLNLYTPFFSARIADLSQNIRDAKEKPGRMATLAMTYAALGYYYALANSEEEWFQQMSDHDKSTRILFPVEDDDGTQTLAEVPLGTWASFFHTIGMKAGNYQANTPEQATAVQLAAMLLGQAAPISIRTDSLENFVGSLTQFGGPLGYELAQQLANKQFYFDRKIEGRGLEFKPLPDRYTQFTSETSKAVGKLTGLSPARIENAIRTQSTVTLDIIKGIEDLTGVKTKPGYETSGPGERTVKRIRDSFMYYTPANEIQDKNTRRLDDIYERYQANKNAETPKEKRIRTRLEKTVSDIGDVSLMMYTLPSGSEERKVMAETRSKLYRNAFRIAGGEPAEAVSGVPRGKAKALRRQRRQERQGGE